MAAKVIEQFDPARHLAPGEIRALLCRYVTRPGEDAEPWRWEEWARQVLDAQPLARSIAAAADEKHLGAKTR